MPAYPFVETLNLEELPDGRTKLVGEVLFFTSEERDAVQPSMEGGLSESFAALDRLLAGPA